MAKAALLSPEQILARTAAHFGQPVRKLTAPGGRSRDSFRAYFDDHSIIVSRRHDSARALLEARILAELSPLTPHVPRLLGQDADLVFQQDAGQDRLNRAIHSLPPADRPALAATAIEALLDIHRAARRAGIAAWLPARGLRVLAGDDLFAGVAGLARQLALPLSDVTPQAFSPWFRQPGQGFTKCDCRAGNAALDLTGHLRWFDFEDARLGHGPEDFAWLIADETWPLDPGLMVDLLATRLTPQDTPDPRAYLAYLHEYAALQAIRRLRLIVGEARRRGWSDRVTILKYDQIGANPHMGERLAIRGADLARQTPATRPLVRLFDAAAEVFRKVRHPPAQDAQD